MISSFTSIARSKIIVLHKNLPKIMLCPMSHVKKSLGTIYTFLLFSYLLYLFINFNGTDGTDKRKRSHRAVWRCPVILKSRGTIVGHRGTLAIKSTEVVTKTLRENRYFLKVSHALSHATLA